MLHTILNCDEYKETRVIDIYNLSKNNKLFILEQKVQLGETKFRRIHDLKTVK